MSQHAVNMLTAKKNLGERMLHNGPRDLECCVTDTAKDYHESTTLI